MKLQVFFSLLLVNTGAAVAKECCLCNDCEAVEPHFSGVQVHEIGFTCSDLELFVLDSDEECDAMVQLYRGTCCPSQQGRAVDNQQQEQQEEASDAPQSWYEYGLETARRLVFFTTTSSWSGGSTTTRTYSAPTKTYSAPVTYNAGRTTTTPYTSFTSQYRTPTTSRTYGTTSNNYGSSSGNTVQVQFFGAPQSNSGTTSSTNHGAFCNFRGAPSGSCNGICYNGGPARGSYYTGIRMQDNLLAEYKRNGGQSSFGSTVTCKQLDDFAKKSSLCQNYYSHFKCSCCENN